MSDILFLEAVCTTIKIVTKTSAGENRWIFGGCSNAREYKNHGEYIEPCCQSPGTYKLVCVDTYQDGWHGGYIEIRAKKYCENFLSGKDETHDVIIGRQVTLGVGGVICIISRSINIHLCYNIFFRWRWIFIGH